MTDCSLKVGPSTTRALIREGEFWVKGLQSQTLHRCRHTHNGTHVVRERHYNESKLHMVTSSKCARATIAALGSNHAMCKLRDMPYELIFVLRGIRVRCSIRLVPKTCLA